jgi:ketosteroid isomerase-like protein
MAYTRAVHANQELIHRFYTAFQGRDAAGMGACYANTVVFSDPVFTRLEGEDARAMWRMLCGRAKDLTVRFEGAVADDHEGRVHWEAEYTYSATGRRVHNIIEASFGFQDGLIVQHTDRFDLWRWMRMALGVKGVLLGWLPPVQGKVQQTAAQSLAHFRTEESAGA